MTSRGTLAFVVFVVLLGFAGCTGFTSYNQLVQEQEQVNQAWGNVQSAYQRRADLIPNLVKTVQGAADFEEQTLQAVIEARAQATSINVDAGDLDDPQAVQQFLGAQQQLGGTLGKLFAVAEQYPELQSVQAFQDLQVQLEGTENRINTARNRYNEAVTQYNTEVRQLPTAIVARLIGFETRSTFEADTGASEVPEVDFGASESTGSSGSGASPASGG